MIDNYLERIKFNGKPEVNLETLKILHRNHLFNIPFEDLDIQNGVRLNLEQSHLLKKIVVNKRGGFCYELNSLFNWLLSEIGFNSRMVAARTFSEDGTLQPEYDHMALLVELNEPWLADVGFGDLLIEPMKLKTGEIHQDLFNRFKIELDENGHYVLFMAYPGSTEFKRQYIFNPIAETIDNFKPECKNKQENPGSHFRINKICTLATPTGRKTIRNNKFIEKNNGIKEETIINGEEHEIMLLKDHFNIVIN